MSGPQSLPFLSITPCSLSPQDLSLENSVFPEKMSNGTLRDMDEKEAPVPQGPLALQENSPTFILQETSL